MLPPRWILFLACLCMHHQGALSSRCRTSKAHLHLFIYFLIPLATLYAPYPTNPTFLPSSLPALVSSCEAISLNKHTRYGTTVKATSLNRCPPCWLQPRPNRSRAAPCPVAVLAAFPSRVSTWLRLLSPFSPSCSARVSFSSLFFLLRCCFSALFGDMLKCLSGFCLLLPLPFLLPPPPSLLLVHIRA